MPTSTQSIREIVDAQPSAAAVLQRFDIDLCSRANASLSDACAELQLSVDQVLEKLAAAHADERGAAPSDPGGLTIESLIKHIVRVHHQRLRQELPRLATMAQKLLAKHGERAPEIFAIEALLQRLRAEMFAHIEKEEQILFPYISQLDQELSVAGSPACAHFRSVTRPISMMVREHDSASGIVAELRRLTHEFEVPEEACATHASLYVSLRSFETNLRQHVHLENDVLFPRAIALESALHKEG